MDSFRSWKSFETTNAYTEFFLRRGRVTFSSMASYGYSVIWVIPLIVEENRRDEIRIKKKMINMSNVE